MKKFAVILPVAVLAAALLAGCASKPTPTIVASETLDAIKAQGFEKLQKNYAGDAEGLNVTDLAGNASGMDLSGLTEDQAAMAKEMVNVMTSFDYELGEETINGDKATVQAKIATYDLGTAISEAMGEYFTSALTSALSGESLSQEEMTAQFVELFTKKATSLTEKTHVATATLNLTQVDGEWKMDELSEEATDAIMGGMISSLKEFVENLGALGNIADAA